MTTRSLLFPEKPRGRCKKSWSAIEDAQLQALVDIHGTSSWTKIAEGLVTRTGKQCRERYHNHLQPNIRKGDWTEEEDRIIVEMQAKLGNQWAKITKMLPGRTDNAVKNRWHAAMRSQGRSTAGDSGEKKTRKTKPTVPSLPLSEMNKRGSEAISRSYSATSHASAEDSDDFDYLFGEDEYDAYNHHTEHAHSHSARTDSNPNTARTSGGQTSRTTYSCASLSPRMEDFMCFPLSSITDDGSALTGRSDSSLEVDTMPVDLGMAAQCSPRDVTRWLSASPRAEASSEDIFFGQGSYISSPSRQPLTAQEKEMLGMAGNGTTFTSTSSSFGAGFGPKPVARGRRSNAQKNGTGTHTHTDLKHFAQLRKQAAVAAATVAAQQAAAEITAAHAASLAAAPKDVPAVPPLALRKHAPRSDGDRIRREVSSPLAQSSEDGSVRSDATDAEEEQHDQFHLGPLELDESAFGRLEVSPRWQLGLPGARLTPRSPRQDTDPKRARRSATPTYGLTGGTPSGGGGGGSSSSSSSHGYSYSGGLGSARSLVMGLGATPTTFAAWGVTPTSTMSLSNPSDHHPTSSSTAPREVFHFGFPSDSAASPTEDQDDGPQLSPITCPTELPVAPEALTV